MNHLKFLLNLLIKTQEYLKKKKMRGFQDRNY